MPNFVISFEDNEEPGVTLCEYPVEADLVGEAIEQATEQFNTEHPGWDHSQITARSRIANA